MLKKIRFLSLFIFILIFIYSSTIIVIYIYNIYQSNKSYNKLNNIYNIEQKIDVEAKNTDLRKEQFNKLKKINEDIIGWIYIPNTQINYPVVKTVNNEFYLNHDAEKNKSKSGAIFMDYRNSLDENLNMTDKNIVLYGHNMKYGTMFADLKKFENSEFFKQNRYVYMDYRGERKSYEVISIFVTGIESNYKKVNFNTNEEFLEFLSYIKDKSLFSNNIKINDEDKILTLITCSYEFDNARLILVAKLIK